jgi:hypothetical protein
MPEVVRSLDREGGNQRGKNRRKKSIQSLEDDGNGKLTHSRRSWLPAGGGSSPVTSTAALVRAGAWSGLGAAPACIHRVLAVGARSRVLAYPARAQGLKPTC